MLSLWQCPSKKPYGARSLMVCLGISFLVLLILAGDPYTYGLAGEEMKEGSGIFNPSFEILKNGEPVGWIFHPGHPKSIIKVTERPDGKGKCLFMRAWEEAKGEEANCDTCSAYEIPIKPNTPYILSASIHGTVRIIIFFYDKYTAGEKEWWTADIEKERKHYDIEGRNLERKSIKFTSPEGAKSLQIQIRVQPHMKEAWIDDLEILSRGGNQGGRDNG